MPSDATGDEVGAPVLCPFCVERLRAASAHGHVDDEWTARTALDLAKQCCSPHDRSLR